MVDEKKTKKLIFTIGNLGVGGAAKMLCYVANLSINYFSDVSIVILRRDEHVFPLHKDIKVYELDLDYEAPGRKITFLTRCSSMRNKLKQLNPDIIISFVNPTIIYSFFAKSKSMVLIGAERGNPERLPRLNRILAKYVYPRCDMVVFQSEGAMKCFSIRTQKKAVVIENPFIPSGIDPGCFCTKRKNTIVSTSRLSKEKNIDIVLKAFSESKAIGAYKLEIYGEGDEEQHLKSLAKELGIDQNVRFMGISKDIMCSIQDSGIFVLASDNEGMPNGLIEAMALGIPCISTKCMAKKTNSLIEHQKNGLIVAKGDVQDLKGAIEYFVDHPTEAERMGKEATRIRSLLDESQIRKKWGVVFEMLLKEKRG